ncbi:MAG TPA: FHA domain-containing protein [Planctomycetaceae bacterium]|nr:FHA domain-containing protein [Planctomycetaceae bacterium]
MRFVFDVHPLDGPASSWTASSASVRIGRDPSNDLILTSEMVSARHAVIEEAGKGALVRDLQSSNGVFLNGARIAGSSKLTVGDVIMLGQQGPTILMQSLDSDAPVGGTMRVPRGAQQSSQLGLRIGRALDNDIVLDDASVSAYHARFFVDSYGRGFVEDSGSLNGIAVGDPNRKVSTAEVSTQDEVYFGSAPLAARELFARLARGGSVPQPVPAESRSDSTMPLIAVFAVIGVAVVAILGYMLSAWKPGASAEVTTTTKIAKEEPKPDKSLPAFPATLEVPRVQTSASHATVEAPPREEPLDTISLERRYTPAMALVGVYKKGTDAKLVIPRAVAWAIKPTLLVTTAKAAAELKYYASKGDVEAVIVVKDTFIPIKAYYVHADFAYDNPASDGSRRHSIGFLEVDQQLESCSPTFPADKQPLRPDAALTVIGYVSLLPDKAALDRSNVKLESGPMRIRSIEEDRPGLPPLYSVDLPQLKGESSARWLDGSPIFNSAGRTVGILSVVNQRIRMISWGPTADFTP